MAIDFGAKIPLTADREYEHKRRSVPGMAHFGGTGPAGRTCRECWFWKLDEHDKHHVYKTSGDQALLPRKCVKYAVMTGDYSAGKIPHATASCKYFEPGDDVPPVHARDAKGAPA